MRPVFGSTKYKELIRYQKLLKKAKTADDKKMYHRQISLLRMAIVKEEKASEEYFGKM